MLYLAIVFLFVVKFMWKNAACVLGGEIFPDIGNFLFNSVGSYE